MGQAENDWITIVGEPRNATGKGVARKLRREGKIPANLIGKGEATSIQLNPKLLGKIYDKYEGKFFLDFEGQKKKVKIHEVCLDVIRREPKHVDLLILS